MVRTLCLYSTPGNRRSPQPLESRTPASARPGGRSGGRWSFPLRSFLTGLPLRHRCFLVTDGVLSHGYEGIRWACAFLFWRKTQREGAVGGAPLVDGWMRKPVDECVACPAWLHHWGSIEGHLTATMANVRAWYNIASFHFWSRKTGGMICGRVCYRTSPYISGYTLRAPYQRNHSTLADHYV